MYDHSLFITTLSNFTRTLLTPYDVDTALGELGNSLTAVLGLAGSGVTLAKDGKLELATTVSPRIAELEKVQTNSQAGPCMDAFQTGEVVAVSDLSEVSDRWPEYCVVAKRLGMISVAGIPMSLQDEAVGAVNLYADGPRDWSKEDLDVAVAMAAMATGYLVNASKLHQQEQLNEQLQQALGSRVIIEQAKGVIASTNGVSVDEAFLRIRRHARSHNAAVRAVAEAIVNVGLRV